MRLDARSPNKPAGVLVDRGTGKRIPFARWFDDETGEYEALQATADGKDILCEEDGSPIVVRGRAVGRLELVPVAGAAPIGQRPPKRVDGGTEVYKKLYFDVWALRGESKRCTSVRFEEYIKKAKFLDDFMVKKR